MFTQYATAIKPHCIFGDFRLTTRFTYVLEGLGEGFGKSIPQCFVKRSAVKAAYNFFNHLKIEHSMLLSAERERLSARIKLDKPPVVLAVQDTTELDYTGKRSSSKLKHLQYKHQKGYHLHNHLLFDAHGNALGVFDQYLWGRDMETLGQKKEKRKQTPFEEKESFRWLEQFNLLQQEFAQAAQTTFVCITDREGDIHELLQARQHEHTHYIVRSRGDRNADQSAEKIVALICATPIRATYTLEVTDEKSKQKRKASVSVRFGRQVVKAAFRHKGFTPLAPTEVGIVLVQEFDVPPGCVPVQWVLFTSLPLHNIEDALQIIEWYKMRWRIEVFHYILKQGCLVQKLQLEEPQALQNAIVTYSFVALQVLRLRYWQDTSPEAAIQSAGFDQMAYKAGAIYLNKRAGAKYDIDKPDPTVGDLIKILGQLAGNMLWKNKPVGVKHLWTGLRDLQIILDAFQAFEAT